MTKTYNIHPTLEPVLQAHAGRRVRLRCSVPPVTLDVWGTLQYHLECDKFSVKQDLTGNMFGFELEHVRCLLDNEDHLVLLFR